MFYFQTKYKFVIFFNVTKYKNLIEKLNVINFKLLINKYHDQLVLEIIHHNYW